MKRETQPIPAKGLVPGSEDEPALYDNVVITGVKKDERGHKRFELATKDNPGHKWTTLPINEGEEERYKKALSESEQS